jgi:hypothetical protein
VALGYPSDLTDEACNVVFQRTSEASSSLLLQSCVVVVVALTRRPIVHQWTRSKALISSKVLSASQATKWVLHPENYPTLAISASLGIDGPVSEMVLCCVVCGIPPLATTTSTFGALVPCPPALFALAIVSFL